MLCDCESSRYTKQFAIYATEIVFNDEENNGITITMGYGYGFSFFLSLCSKSELGPILNTLS